MVNICHVNVTSIRKHKDELLAQFFHCEIWSINESNLEPNQPFSLKGFNIYRNDRPNQSGGGVLLAIKDDIKCHEIINKTVEKNEIIAVQIETSTAGTFLVASIYIPPTAKICTKLFEELHRTNNNCLILGDLNAALQAMGSKRTNAKGRQLQEILNDGFLQCIDNDLTTFERNKYEEKLDWVLASYPLISYISNVETHPPLGLLSGHKPLTFEMSMMADRKPGSPRLSFNFRAAVWPVYRQQLNKELVEWNGSKDIETPAEIETYTTFLTDCIVVATKSAIPAARQTLKNMELSETTKKMIKLKHQAYRRWKKSETDFDKEKYYTTKILLSNAIRNERIANFNKLMLSLSKKKFHSTQVWATVRKFHNKRTKQSYANNIKYHNTTATTDKEKADLFAEYFENEVFVESADLLPFHRQVTEQANAIRNRFTNTSIKKKPKSITVKEVKATIKQLTNSSPGPDNVHNRCLKNYTKSLIEHLTRLFNSVINVGYIPFIWKRANIILLLKPKKDKQQPSSYRPISLLSCLGKLLEKIFKQRLTTELDRRNILPAHQAGFRARKGTLYNMVRLERFARDQLNQRRHSAVIFFDIKAAFDSVWYDGLIYKLNDLRIPEYMTRYIVSFLENRTASIELENTLSRMFTLRSGTPQGSPLSPLLYILFTSDSMNGIFSHTEHGLFADDTALWTSSNTTSNLSTRLQQSVDEFQRWCAAWKLKLQPIKTEMIHFSPHPKKKYKNLVRIKIENTVIKPQDSARYLGVIFDRKLDWRCHTKHIESKAAARISLLRFLSRAARSPNEKIMLNIFKALVRTILTYGFPILLTANDKVWGRLQITQNKAIRAALGIPPYTSVEYTHHLSNIPRIKQYSITLLEQSIIRTQTNKDQVLETALREILAEI